MIVASWKNALLLGVGSYAVMRILTLLIESLSSLL